MFTFQAIAQEELKVYATLLEKLQVQIEEVVLQWITLCKSLFLRDVE
jgi:hypothetical protein